MSDKELMDKFRLLSEEGKEKVLQSLDDMQKQQENE